MKYTKIKLNLSYENYSEIPVDNLNGCIKNRVYYSLGEYIIHVDKGYESDGINKIKKHLNTKFKVLNVLLESKIAENK